MQCKTRVVLRLLVALIATSIVDFASAQTVGTGTYYATPSWDQTIATKIRFIVLANFNSEAVLDRETGLVWQKTIPSDPADIETASTNCANLLLGGRLGFRLPTIDELTSLYTQTSASYFALPADHPFTLPATSVVSLWSQSVSNPSTHKNILMLLAGSRLVDVFNGATVGAILPSLIAPGGYWCVRGGQR